MSASTMIIQPESPSSHFIDDIEPDYDYALEDLDIEEPTAELIFDWDDTLLPSTWLNLKGLRLDYPEIIPEDVVQALAPTPNTLLPARICAHVCIPPRLESCAHRHSGR